MTADFRTITGETWRRSLIAARQRFARTTDRIRSQIPANHLMPTPTPRPLAKQILDLLCRQGATGVSADDIMNIVQPHMEDTARLDWLDAHPLQASLHGGKEDGGTAKAWAVAGHQSLTLRQTIDGIRKAHA